VITAVKPGKKSGATYVQLDTGAIAGTESPDLIAHATAFQASGEVVVLLTQPHRKLGAELLSITAEADVLL
jgi:hypothetical protein